MQCNDLHKVIRTVLLVATAFLPFVNAQILNVTAQDPRIDYVGDWVDQDSGGHKFTNTLGSSLSFTFQGSAVFWYSTKDPNGGVASVSVDSDSPQFLDASTGTEKNDSPTLEVMFSQSNLDASKEHTFNITYIGPGSFGGPYVTIYLLAFSEAANSATETVPTSSSSVVTPKSAQHDTVTASVTHTVTADTHPLSETVTTTNNLSYTTTSTIPLSSSANISTSVVTTSTLAPVLSVTPSAIGSAIGTQSLTTPSHSPSDISAVLHATQRMNVILGAILGPIGGLVLIGAIIVLMFWLRHRKRHRLREGEAAPLFTREALIPSRPGFGSKIGATRPQFTPRTPSSGLSDTGTRFPSERGSPSMSEITEHVGQDSVSDLGTSPPEYSA